MFGFVARAVLRALGAQDRRSSNRVRGTRAARPTLETLEERRMLTLTWEVQTDFFAERNVISQTRSLRGLALTNDATSIYGGFINGTSTSGIRKVDATETDQFIGNDMPSVLAPNPAYTDGLQASVSTGAVQPKGVAVDDRGYVYTTLSNPSANVNQAFGVYSSDLSAQLATYITTAALPSQLGGISVAKVGTEYYAYISRNGGSAQIERWNVTNPLSATLDTSWGSSGKINLKSVSGWTNAFANGLEADSDGTLYVAGGILGTGRGDSVFKIPADGNLDNVTRVDVNGAMDLALFLDKVYVTQYLAASSTISVLLKDDLSLDETITTTPRGTYPTGADSGYSGIDISFDGRIYVVEQIYDFINGVYTPPGGSAFASNRFYFDRILVSSQLVTPAITYVDDDWSMNNNGDQVMVGSQTLVIGYNAFATIQGGIDNVADLGTVFVLNGTYTEDVDATSKAITLATEGDAGEFTIDGSLTLDADDTLVIAINGNTPGTEYDQITVTGALTLGGATLDLGGTIVPAGDDKFIFIAATDAASDEFVNYTDKELVTFNGGKYRFRYAGGDGNDVSLEAAPTIVSVGPVIPNPRGVPVETVEVVFSKPIDLATFDYQDLNLSLDGGLNLIDDTVTISLVSGSTYEISGLAPLTALDGTYVLTVDASAIDDPDGNTGDGSLDESWFVDTVFSIDGTVLTVNGSGADDRFVVSFTGATTFDVTLNDRTESFDTSMITQVVLSGAGGDDIARVDGTDGVQTARLAPGAIRVTFADLEVTSTNVERNLFMGGSEDIARFVGSAGDDTVYFLPTSVTMQGTGYLSQAFNVGTAYASSGGDGNDTAYFTGSNDNDTFYGLDGTAIMMSTGRYAQAIGFDAYYATAVDDDQDDFDVAILLGRAGQGDTFFGSPTNASLIESTAFGFHSVFAFGSDPDDTAQLFDSAGDDVFSYLDAYASMIDSTTAVNDPGYYALQAIGFGNVFGFASDGNDLAVGYGASGDNLLTGFPTEVTLITNGVTIIATGFDSVVYLGNGGNNEAFLFDSPGDDILVAETDFLTLATDQSVLYLFAMQSVTAFSSAGGTDVKFVLNPGYTLTTDGPWIDAV